MRTKEELKQAVIAAIDAHRDEIIGIGETVWKNPEPGYREFKTAALATDVLRQQGLTVRDKLAITGLRADYAGANPGPTVAIIGEMDSLILPTHPDCDPATGAVHACGHHAHITGMLGAAIGLCQAQAAAELSGRVAFVGVPAEECIEADKRCEMIRQGKISAVGGKQEMIREGVFDDVDIAFMHHVNSSENNYIGRSANGFVIKKIIFHGQSCHAANPSAGVNALSICTLAQTAIGLMRETLVEPTVRVHGIITAGGDVVNIIPDCIKLEYMIRGKTLEIVKEISQKFDQAMHGCASALGGTAEVITIPGYADHQGSQEIFEVFKTVVRGLHPDAKMNNVLSEGFSMGSSDMGDITYIMPALETSIPGVQGTGHGITLKPGDPEKAYIDQAKFSALMVIEMLYGDAAKGREIAAEKANKLTKAQYIEMMDALAR